MKNNLKKLKSLKHSVTPKKNYSKINMTHKNKGKSKRMGGNAPTAADNSQPLFDNSQPPVDNSQPPVDNSQPPVDNSQPPVDNSQPQVDKSQPPVLTNQIINDITNEKTPSDGKKSGDETKTSDGKNETKTSDGKKSGDETKTSDGKKSGDETKTSDGKKSGDETKNKDDAKPNVIIEIENKQMQLYTIGLLHNSIISEISLKNSLSILSNNIVDKDKKNITDMQTKISENIKPKIEMLDNIQKLLNIPLEEQIDISKLMQLQSSDSNAASGAWQAVQSAIVGSMMLFSIPALL